MNSLDPSYIPDTGFQFIPNFDLDYLFIRINVIGGVYNFNDKILRKFIISFLDIKCHFVLNLHNMIL